MGRHPTGKIPNQPLKIISERHRDIMRRLIVGESQRQIARDLGMSEGRLSVICNSPLFKRELEKLSNEVKEKFVDHTAETAEAIDELQPYAIRILAQILKDKEDDGKNPIPLRLKKDTALDILEIAGTGKKQKSADDAGDIVKLIAEGFKLANSAKQIPASTHNNEQEPINITPVNSEDIEETVSDSIQ